MWNRICLRRTGVFALLVALGTALGARVGAEIVEHVIAPKTTDPMITTAFEDHYALVNTSVAPESDLFVFMPGSRGKPADTKLIMQQAASLGFRTIGLMYPNAFPLYSLCSAANPDPNCHEKVRREIVTGDDASELISVSRADSIESRLVKLLQYLAATYPMEGWGAWLVGGEPNWRRIRLSGWSQGGGHAAFIGKTRELAGAISFSAPQDWDLRLNRPAAWIGAPGVTPASRHYGFSHMRDATALWPQVEAIWAVLGMPSFGSLVLVDDTAPPYGSSHQLRSNLPLPPIDGSRFHSMTVVDQYTPREADGTPTYARVWRAAAFWK